MDSKCARFAVKNLHVTIGQVSQFSAIREHQVGAAVGHMRNLDNKRSS